VLTSNDIKYIANSGEGYNAEFKERVPQKVRELAEEICAFANSAGGYLLIGIDDKNEIIGVEINNKTRSAIQDAIGHIAPQIKVETYPVDVEGKNVRVIDVPSGQRKPYLLSGSIYIREGANTQKLTDLEEVRASFQQSNSVFFDEVPCLKFNPANDLDTEFIRDFKSMAEFQCDIPDEHLFTNLKLYDDEGYFKNGAVLFFGRQPEDFLDNAFVHCVAFDGINKRFIADDKKMFGNLYRQYTQTLRWLKQNLRVRFQIEGQDGGPRKELWEIPEEALKEALINSLSHRDYCDKRDRTMVEVFNDRVVITNPGGLISSIPPDKFGTMSLTRNPLIFGLFERIRLVGHIGSGVLRMCESMKEEQLPAPDFGLEGMFNITLKRPVSVEYENDGTIEELPKLTEIQIKVFDLIRNNENITTDGISETLSISRRYASLIIKRLKILNYIGREGSDKTGIWKVKIKQMSL
jgi:ATP-dependent DNA helicase RecG